MGGGKKFSVFSVQFSGMPEAFHRHRRGKGDREAVDEGVESFQFSAFRFQFSG